jgi:hypothetical protein
MQSISPLPASHNCIWTALVISHKHLDGHFHIFIMHLTFELHEAGQHKYELQGACLSVSHKIQSQ